MHAVRQYTCTYTLHTCTINAAYNSHARALELANNHRVRSPPARQLSHCSRVAPLGTPSRSPPLLICSLSSSSLFRPQFDNVNSCLHVLRTNSVCGLDSITPSDICAGRLKAVLALFFALSRFKQASKQKLPANSCAAGGTTAATIDLQQQQQQQHILANQQQQHHQQLLQQHQTVVLCNGVGNPITVTANDMTQR